MQYGALPLIDQYRILVNMEKKKQNTTLYVKSNTK